MNQVVRGALNICTVVYLCVGFFGYIAFCTQPFTGNILMSFEPSLTSDIIKMGFVFSVAFSFPLVIFPCRASLNSLLFRRAHTHEPSNYYIPELRFRCLTFTIVAISLGTGILIPNIELVLGIVGSTIGVMICLIFPAAFFIAISTKNTNERLIAQAILFFGMWIMVLGTYANLYAMEESTNTRLVIITDKPMVNQINNIPINNLLQDGFPLVPQVPNEANHLEEIKETLEEPKKKSQEKNDEAMDVRREPPIPVERSAITERLPIESQNLGANLVVVSLRPKIEKMVNEMKILNDNLKDSKLAKATVVGESSKDIPAEVVDQQAAAIKLKSEEKDSKGRGDQQRNENLIDSDAIKKEESELAAARDQADLEAAARHEKLRQTLEKHKLEQLEMMQEQKEILKDIKEQKQEYEMEKKRLAMEHSKKNDEIQDESRRAEIKVKEKKTVSADENIVDIKDPVLKTVNEKDDKENAPVVRVQPNLEKNDKKLSNLVDKSPSKVGTEESRGPILNALTNWTSKVNGSRDGNVKLNKKTEVLDNSNNRVEQEVIDKNKVTKKSGDFALPIALQMRNQSKLSSERELSLKANKTTDDGLSIRRHILERRDREKRDTVEREIVSQNNKLTNEQCERKTSEKIDTKTTSIPTTEIDIKTAVYLAEQGFTEKILSLNPSNVGSEQANMPKLKKRDLKALRPGH